MNTTRQLFIAATFTCLSFVGNAGSLLPGMLGGQVQQFTDKGVVSGCGVTLFGIELNAPRQSLVFNGSIVIYKTGLSVVKGRGSEVDAKLLGSKDFDVSKMKALNTPMFWLRANGAPATTIANGGKFIESEDKGYRLYPSPFEPAIKFVESVLIGEKVQIGLTVSGRNSEQVLFGLVEMSEDEKSQLRLCLGELSAE